MTALPRNITFDCADPYLLVGFWSQVTGYGRTPRTRTSPATPRATWPGPAASPGCCSSRCRRPRPSRTGSTWTWCPSDGTRDEEVERLLGIGATLVADHRRSDRMGWVVLADPEGNELCIERSAAERAAAG